MKLPVPSRTFLFRAGGVGTAKGGSTGSGREEAFRARSNQSPVPALVDLSRSLDAGVAAFRQELLSGARCGVVLLDTDGHPLGSQADDPTRR